MVFYREFDITKRRIEKILKAGANVVLTTGGMSSVFFLCVNIERHPHYLFAISGIDDLCLKQFVETGAMAVRRCKKTDLKRIAKATGG